MSLSQKKFQSIIGFFCCNKQFIDVIQKSISQVVVLGFIQASPERQNMPDRVQLRRSSGINEYRLGMTTSRKVAIFDSIFSVVWISVGLFGQQRIQNRIFN